MNPEELKAAVAELRQKWEARAQGEWRVAGELYRGSDGGKHAFREIVSNHIACWIAKVQGFDDDYKGTYAANAEFIAAAHNHLPAILDEIQRLTAALANRDKQIADMDAELEAHATDRVNQRAEVARLTAELANRDARIEDMDAGLGTEALRAEVEKLRAALAEWRTKAETYDEQAALTIATLTQSLAEAEKERHEVAQDYARDTESYLAQIANLVGKNATLESKLKEAEKRAHLMGLDAHPITICPECNGTGIPKPPKQPQCCPIGHAKECACLLCQWRRSAYKKDAELLCESNYRYAEKARAEKAESLYGAENSKVAGLMTRWHEEIARREQAESVCAESENAIRHCPALSEWGPSTQEYLASRVAFLCNLYRNAVLDIQDHIARRERAEQTIGEREGLILRLWDAYSKDGNGEPVSFGRPNIANAIAQYRLVVAAIRAARDSAK